METGGSMDSRAGKGQENIKIGRRRRSVKVLACARPLDWYPRAREPLIFSAYP